MIKPASSITIIKEKEVAMKQETLSGLARKLGLSRQTLHSYIKKYPELHKFIEEKPRGKRKFYFVMDRTGFLKELKKLGVFIPAEVEDEN